MKPISSKRAMLDLLRDRYVAQGYQFYERPPAELLPPFFADFRPDAIALSQSERVALVVVVRPGKSGDDRLESAAQRFASQKAWTLRVVYAEDSFTEERMLQRAPPEVLDGFLSSVRTLIDQKQTQAALLMAWSALEAAARLVRASPVRTMLSAKQVVELLEYEGLIADEVGDKLRSIADLRNAVAHGDLAVSVEPDTAEYVYRAARRLVEEHMRADATT